VCKFRHLLEAHQTGGTDPGTGESALAAQGVRSRTGRSWTRHPARTHLTRTGSSSAIRRCTRRRRQTMVLRMKAHVGVASNRTKIIPHGGGDGGQRSRFGGAADLLHGEETRVGAIRLIADRRSDPGVRAAGPGLHPSALPLQGWGDEVERAKNRSKSTVRSKVEHVVCGDEAESSGFVKLRFRGLKKNATQLFACARLVNLYLARKTVALRHRLARERRLLITGEPPSRRRPEKTNRALAPASRTLTTSEDTAYSEFP